MVVTLPLTVAPDPGVRLMLASGVVAPTVLENTVEPASVRLSAKPPFTAPGKVMALVPALIAEALVRVTAPP